MRYTDTLCACEVSDREPLTTVTVVAQTFIFLVLFVLLNMFIAILTEAYEKAKVRRGKRSSNSPSDLI